MSQLLEATMLICFGISWPINLYKSIKAKTAKFMSIQFICLILFGYMAGTTAKIVSHTFNYVFAIYLFNLITVFINLLVYFSNLKLDKAREAANK